MPAFRGSDSPCKYHAQCLVINKYDTSTGVAGREKIQLHRIWDMQKHRHTGRHTDTHTVVFIELLPQLTNNGKWKLQVNHLE